jgi:hypothetical protein
MCKRTARDQGRQASPSAKVSCLLRRPISTRHRVVEDVDAEGRAFQKAVAATVRRIVNMTALTVCRNQLCAPMPDPISHSRSR